MKIKKLLALLVSAALALSLLAGCGGGQQSVARTLLNLLDGQYQNVSVEMDPDLEAKLRQVLSENESDDEAAIRAALETALGSTITFRYLGEGQQGATTFDLVFYAGSDPDKATQTAYNQWNPILSNVPADGKYNASLALVETENGVWMLVQATVEKAGTPDKPDKDDDEPETNIVKGTGFSYDVDHNQVTVSGAGGLQELFTDTTNTNSDLAKARADGFINVVITLDANKEYIVSRQLATDFKGTLKGKDETSQAQITLSGGASLFGAIAGGAEVSNLDITVTNSINATTAISNYTNAGAVAARNLGNITGCKVTINENISITANGSSTHVDVGGLVGSNENNGEISGCEVIVNGTVSAEKSNGNNATAGGLVGSNNSGTITSCTVTINGSIQATGKDNTAALAGGITGFNMSNIEGSNHVTLNSTITATAESNYSSARAGGLVGFNSRGTVNGTWSGGGTITANSYKNSNGKYTYTATANASTTTDVAPENESISWASAGTECGSNNGLPSASS